MNWSVDPDDLLGVSLADVGLEPLPATEPKPVEPADFEAPRIVEGLSFDQYHGDPSSIGAGGIRLLGRSPLHFWHAYLRDGREPAEVTDAQRLGTAIHCAVLEPGCFPSRFSVRPPCDRRTKEGKAIYADFQASLNGRTELTTPEYQAAMEVREAFDKSPFSHYLNNGRSELSAYWTDRATGVRCRMRPDFVCSDRPFLIDLKSCTDASERAFTSHAWRMGYHITAAWYVDGWKAVTGDKVDYIFAAWEKEPPYAAQWYYADDLLLEAGRAAYRHLLNLYAECRTANEWPSYNSNRPGSEPALNPLFPPAWAIED